MLGQRADTQVLFDASKNACGSGFAGVKKQRQDQTVFSENDLDEEDEIRLQGNPVRMANREALLTTHRSIFHNSGR